MYIHIYKVHTLALPPTVTSTGSDKTVKVFKEWFNGFKLPTLRIAKHACLVHCRDQTL